jgi:zinc finger protein
MDRDIFKSETAEIEIPEIGVVVVSGSLGGVYSTIEGLLDKMLSTLVQDNPFIGDSAPTGQKSSFEIFCDRLRDLKDGLVFPFTVIMDDPLSNCFV